MDADSKSFLMITRSSPYSGSAAQEALDIALAAGAFNQNFAVLFMDDGIYQLTKEQHTDELGQKNLSKTLPMLELYGASRLYVEQTSLERRELTAADLALNADVINGAAISALVSATDIVFSG